MPIIADYCTYPLPEIYKWDVITFSLCCIACPRMNFLCVLITGQPADFERQAGHSYGSLTAPGSPFGSPFRPPPDSSPTRPPQAGFGGPYNFNPEEVSKSGQQAPHEPAFGFRSKAQSLSACLYWPKAHVPP